MLYQNFINDLPHIIRYYFLSKFYNFSKSSYVISSGTKKFYFIFFNIFIGV